MDTLKSQAYLIWEEWGPDRLIPRDQRLDECFPQVPAAERELWMSEFEKVASFVSNIANEGLATSYSYQEFADLIRQEFDFMDDAAVTKAHFLANYYQWHG